MKSKTDLTEVLRSLILEANPELSNLRVGHLIDKYTGVVKNTSDNWRAQAMIEEHKNGKS